MKLKTVLTLLALAIVIVASQADAYRFSVGAFGGLNIPVAQDDAKSGTAYGVKARLPLTGFIAVEPNYTYLKNGDGEVTVDENGWNEVMKNDGGTFNSFGVDILIGNVLGYSGFGAYGMVGLSTAKFERTGIPSNSNGSYWLGLGFEYTFNDQVSVELRGKAIIFPYDDPSNTLNNNKGSRKNGLLTVGINYYFGFTQ